MLPYILYAKTTNKRTKDESSLKLALLCWKPHLLPRDAKSLKNSKFVRLLIDALNLTSIQFFPQTYHFYFNYKTMNINFTQVIMLFSVGDFTEQNVPWESYSVIWSGLNKSGLKWHIKLTKTITKVTNDIKCHTCLCPSIFNWY